MWTVCDIGGTFFFYPSIGCRQVIDGLKRRTGVDSQSAGPIEKESSSPLDIIEMPKPMVDDDDIDRDRNLNAGERGPGGE